MTYKNNSCVCVILTKGGAHWSNCSPNPLERGSEALLSKGLEGLSDSLGGDS